MADDREIAAFYDEGREAGRLEDWGRLEFARTLELLERYLPPPPAVVLDVGGGAGAYALPLARRGYEVHLLDPIALHVEQALAAARADPAAALASGRIGDARALPYADAGADAVLLLGPLYHLTEAGHRERALGEALRVLRSGGLLAAVGISRFASTLHGILGGLLANPAFEALVERDVAEGQHRNPRPRPALVHDRLLPPPGTTSAARWRAPASMSAHCSPSRARSACTASAVHSTSGSTTPSAARSSCARSAASRPSRACSAPART